MNIYRRPVRTPSSRGARHDRGKQHTARDGQLETATAITGAGTGAGAAASATAAPVAGATTATTTTVAAGTTSVSTVAAGTGGAASAAGTGAGAGTAAGTGGATGLFALLGPFLPGAAIGFGLQQLVQHVLEDSPTIEAPPSAPAEPISLPGVEGPMCIAPPESSGTTLGAPASESTLPRNDPGTDSSRTLHAGTPNTARRNEHNYGGWYWDPFTNEVKTGLKEITPADHIYPEALIMKLPGFDKLTPVQKQDVLNYSNNFQPLPGWLNSSKGAKTYFEWTSAPTKLGDPSWVQKFHPEYAKAMQQRTLQIVGELNVMIHHYGAK